MSKYSEKQIEGFHLLYRSMPAVLNVSDCARQMRVPANTLRNWIKKRGWERDLSDEVMRRTNIAVQKATLGLDTDKPLNDEEKAIADRVAVNVAIITAQQTLLSKFGVSLEKINDQFSQQVGENVVSAVDPDSDTGYRIAPKALGKSIGEARQLMSTFSEFFEEQRKVWGLKDAGDTGPDPDAILRELAEEAAAHQPQEADDTE